MAKKENLHFMDASKFAQASDIDGIHLDPTGHEKLAKAVYDKINDIFG